MRFDVCTLGDHLLDPFTKKYNETQAQRHQTIVEMGVRAEKLGFGGIWIGEHHASDYIVASPHVILAAIASQTSRIRLGSAVSLLPNNDPVRLAEDFATLDLISNGRAEIGFGSGITDHTFALFGQDIKNATEISAENLELIQILWNELDVNWKGKFRAPISDTRLEPRTVSGKSLPITRATGSSEAIAIDAAKRGHKLSLMNVISGFSSVKPLAKTYRDAYLQSGQDKANMSVAGAAFVCIRPNGQKAREHWGPYFGTYQAFSQMLLQSKGMSRGIADLFHNIIMKTPEVLHEAQFVGEPSEVVEMIERAYESMGGFDEIKLLFDVGGQSREDVLLSMELFAEKVMPNVRVSKSAATGAVA